MKSILYISHTAWSWIKQRPQFLAEGLSESYKVDVFYRKSNHFFKNLNPPRYQDSNFSVTGFRNIPWERIKYIRPERLYPINKLFWSLEKVDLNKYDYIWVTDPLLWWLIKKRKFRGKVIYDCMDDLLAFPYYERYPNIVSFTQQEERDLLLKADVVLFSAQTLKEKLYKRYDISRMCNIVNNAITEEITSYSESIDDIILPNNSFVYIGTISEWFDFDLVISALQRYKDINIVLYGPIRMANPPQHDRLIYAGSIGHDKVLGLMNKAKALIMPFVVNELILSVNPVKLYEYIYSGKPIISVRYPETEKFGDYVCLYNNNEEFYSFIEEVIGGASKRDLPAMRKFSLDNTWRARCNDIKNILEGHA